MQLPSLRVLDALCVGASASLRVWEKQRVHQILRQSWATLSLHSWYFTSYRGVLAEKLLLFLSFRTPSTVDIR